MVISGNQWSGHVADFVDLRAVLQDAPADVEEEDEEQKEVVELRKQLSKVQVGSYSHFVLTQALDAKLQQQGGGMRAYIGVATDDTTKRERIAMLNTVVAMLRRAGAKVCRRPRPAMVSVSFLRWCSLPLPPPRVRTLLYPTRRHTLNKCVGRRVGVAVAVPTACTACCLSNVHAHPSHPPPHRSHVFWPRVWHVYCA
jgi:hypothetical protein